jgi:beta-glucosidase
MTTTQERAIRRAVPLRFPEGFRFGAATASYQIEGAATEDGRGMSIWDTFSHLSGKVRGGDTGDVACDSYHRYREDVALVSELGLGAYRFSIAWPRVLPDGFGDVNQKGLDYYRALVDTLREHGIAPVVTLYHWDLPQSLQDVGGWSNRAVAEAFAEYAGVVAEALRDTVAMWITLNEPQVVVQNGHRTGEHAPGITDPARAAAANHHLLLAHGLATDALRSALPSGIPVGITLNLNPVRPAAEGVDSLVATVDAENNGCYLTPVLQGRYPPAARAHIVPDDSIVRDGDLQLISRPIDFLGVNYYAPLYVRHGDWDDLCGAETPMIGYAGVVTYAPPAFERTSMGWLIEPQGLYDIVQRVAREAPGLTLYVTENGCAAEDYVNPEGKVLDEERIKYLHLHLAACARAVADGLPLAGYFVWSLLDNFEWARGYQKRFGIVYVDFSDQRRIVKESARFYAKVVSDRAVPPLPEDPGLLRTAQDNFPANRPAWRVGRTS